MADVPTTTDPVDIAELARTMDAIGVYIEDLRLLAANPVMADDVRRHALKLVASGNAALADARHVVAAATVVPLKFPGNPPSRC